MQVILPWPPSDLNPNKRIHWAKKAKATKAYRRACYLLCVQAGLTSIPWDGDVHLWLDFYPPDRRRRDDDNAYHAFKAGRDGMADALKINDNRFRAHPYFRDEIGGMVKVTITPGPIDTSK